MQLAALAQNDKPAYDHGIEVLYRFANFDPFSRSKYFGCEEALLLPPESVPPAAAELFLPARFLSLPMPSSTLRGEH